jgi:GT2 family glycosyltransferase
MPEISISIVNFNAKDKLKGCLESIRKNISGIDYEVIVVDNASSDGSVEMIKNEFPSFRVIANKDNSGATVAKNLSFKSATGRYILILDSDIELLPGAVSRMLDFMKADSSVGIAGPKVFFPNLKQQHSCNKGFPKPLSVFFNRILFLASIRYRFYRSGLGNIYLKSRYNRQEKFAWLGGMCLLARADLLKSLNGMDERFFIYYDDTDLCLRANKAGFEVYYLPEAQVIHHLSESVGKFSNFLFPKIYESELYFFRKHYGIFGVRICAVIIRVSMCLRLVLSLFALTRDKDALRKKRQAYRQVFILAGKGVNG